MSKKKCRKCHSEETVKNGKQSNIQRYKCKKCDSTFRDCEQKHSLKDKMEALQMYLRSMSIRGIAQIKNVHHSVVASWIKKMGKIAKEKFYEEMDKVQDKDIQIMEIDEMFTYVKKKPTGRLYLLLSTEKVCELLISK